MNFKAEEQMERKICKTPKCCTTVFMGLEESQLRNRKLSFFFVFRHVVSFVPNA